MGLPNVMKSEKGGIWSIWNFTKYNDMKKKVLNKVKYPRQKGLWGLLDLLFRSWMGETFRLLGRRRGHKAWASLDPRYKAWKTGTHRRRSGGSYGPYSEDPMTLHGHLKASFQILRQTEKQMMFGTDIPYARYHQEPEPGAPYPKREMVFVTARDRRDIESLYTNWLAKGL